MNGKVDGFLSEFLKTLMDENLVSWYLLLSVIFTKKIHPHVFHLLSSNSRQTFWKQDIQKAYFFYFMHEIFKVLRKRKKKHILEQYCLKERKESLCL